MLHGALDPVADVVGVQSRAVSADEEGAFVDFDFEPWPGGFEIAAEPVNGALAERDGAAFAALAFPHGEDASGEVDVFEVELGHLRATQAAGVEDFQNAAVAQAEHVAGVGQGEEVGEFVVAEGFGEDFGGLAREFEVCCGIGLQDVLAAEPCEEPLHGSEAVALGGDAERLAVVLPVAVEPALEGFEDGLGEVVGLDEVALVAPLEERFQSPSVHVEGARAVGALFEPLHPGIGEAGERVGAAAVEAVGGGIGLAAFAPSAHAGDVAVAFALGLAFGFLVVGHGYDAIDLVGS